MQELLETNVLVIGSGIAGGTAALQLADQGLSVLVITRTQEPQESNTYYAQGGIIYRGAEDTPRLLSEDIIRAGAGHCQPDAVDTLSTHGPELVRELLVKKLAVAFDRTPDGNLSLTREGGHSMPRILHAADATGKAIEIALIKALQAHPNVTLMTGHTSVDLLTPSHHALNRLAVYNRPSCAGAYILNQAEKQVIRCLADHTILATGGLGQIFLRSSNPAGARGDGIAMANRAGARVINAEFTQFHPTTFHHSLAPHFLITEAVRGEGARLVHANGEPFLEQYAPKWKDLAPRDIVSRAIHQEMLKRDLSNVYLDLCSYISKEHILTHFPNIYEQCLTYDIDITQDLVPVVPAAHYSCGGVWVDKWGSTTIRNLYAVGEVACTGLHGANGIASSSLLEGLVWGSRAAQHIINHAVDEHASYASDIPSWQGEGHESPDPALISQDMSRIKHTMWNYVGLVRTSPRLRRAIRELRSLENEIEQFYRESQLTDSLLGLRNAVRTAIIVTFAAWENKHSMGCHYRE